MTFTRFEQIFKTKYPEGRVFMHGEYGQTQKSRKVAVIFNAHSKVYCYYGAYEDILCKVGIKTITKSRYHEIEFALDRAKRSHGQKSMFGDFIIDESRYIAEYTALLKDYDENYIIV